MTDTNKNYSFGQQPTGCQHGGASLELKCTLCAEIALAYLRVENKKLRAVREAAEAACDLVELHNNGLGCCATLYSRRPCDCGGDERAKVRDALRAALDDAKEIE